MYLEGQGDSWEWQITNLRCIRDRLFWLLKVHITGVELVEPGGKFSWGTCGTTATDWFAARELRPSIDPEFFIALKEHLLPISHVEI